MQILYQKNKACQAHFLLYKIYPEWYNRYMDQIKILNNIISSSEANFYIDYIDNNISKFDDYASTNNPNRFVWRFGVDNVYYDSNYTLEKLSDIHTELRVLFDRVTAAIQKKYQSPKKLYVTSFHLGKQFPNSIVNTHLDADPDHNGHFKYSCVVYLNSNRIGGELTFPQLNYKYQPNAMDAVVFPSQGEEYEHEVMDISEIRYSLPMWITEDPEWELKFS